MRPALSSEQFELMLSLERGDDRLMTPGESAIAIDLWMQGLCLFDGDHEEELVAVLPTDAGRLAMTCYRLAQEASPCLR